MKVLEKILYELPQGDAPFKDKFENFFIKFLEKEKNFLSFKSSNSDYLPKVLFTFTDISKPQVKFIFSDATYFTLLIRNITNVDKKSPHEYSSISIDDCMNRIRSMSIKEVDHIGFNLPFFDGIHPEILQLREEVKNTCLYHTFPKELADEPWDFIIPATREEILRESSINYDQIRRPKTEIVSFSKSSTPLIQFDLQLDTRYIDFKRVFPEGIDVPEINCVWVYIKNEYGIDICFVLNEFQEGDWSHYFKNSRI